MTRIRLAASLTATFALTVASTASARLTRPYGDERGGLPTQGAAPVTATPATAPATSAAEPARPAEPTEASPSAQAPQAAQGPQAAPGTPGQPAPAAAPPAAEQANTITLVLPAQRLELDGRLGAIAGGEVTPKKLLVGHVQPSWVAIVDLDYVFHPFFTIGLYGDATNAGYERFLSDKKTNTDGSMTLVSLGGSLKGRIPLGQDVVLKAGATFGYNIVSFSVTESGKTVGASGGGLNIGLTTELAYAVSKSVALTAQIGFVSQVAGSVKVDGASDSNDLAFPPLLFAAVGPELRF